MMSVLFIFFVLTFFFYVYLIWVLDRYEKEPLRNVCAVLIWSTIFAPAGALFLQLLAAEAFHSFFPFSKTLRHFLSAIVVAPLVEESLKGIVLFFPFIFRQIDSYLDGAYYGALSGLGFAFTEDLLYILSAYSSNGGIQSAIGLFIARSIFLGMNHAFFTSMTGIGIAYFILKRWYVMPFIGWTFAVLFHAFHNILTIPGSVGGFILATSWHWLSGSILFAILITFVYHEKKILQATGADWEDSHGSLSRLYTGFFSRFTYLVNQFQHGGILKAYHARKKYNAYAHFLLAWNKAFRCRDLHRMKELLQRAQTLQLRYTRPLPEFLNEIIKDTTP